MIDEGPSPEDLERFGDDTAHCPACGAEIWDQAPICTECGEALDDGTSSRDPFRAWWRQRWLLLAALLALIGLLLWAM